MSKIQKLRDAAMEQAFRSPSKFKHGALVCKGNKIYATGFNNPRTTFLNKKDCCQHAEMAAVSYFMNNVVRRHPQKYWLKEGFQKQEIT